MKWPWQNGSTLASHARDPGFESWAGQSFFAAKPKHFKILQKFGDQGVSCATSSFIYLDNTLASQRIYATNFLYLTNGIVH